MDLSQRLDQITNLLSEGLQREQQTEKTASSNKESGADAALTTLRMGLLVQSKKASYLDMFKGLRGL